MNEQKFLQIIGACARTNIALLGDSPKSLNSKLTFLQGRIWGYFDALDKPMSQEAFDLYQEIDRKIPSL